MASSSSQRVSRFIPEEIITAIILPKLPVKDLCRFKCVSKPWRSLISSQRFVKAHLLAYSHKFPRIVLNIGEENYRLIHLSLNSLLNDSNSEEDAINIDFPEKNISGDQFAWCVGSCNGLLCISIFPDLFLLNPSSRQCKMLPRFNGEMNIKWNVAKHRFLYTAAEDDYKVFCFYSRTGEFQANVFSLRANSWTTPITIKASATRYYEELFFAGKIHFGKYDPGLNLDHNEADPLISFDIVSFDLISGEYGTIGQPNYGDGVKRLFVVELGGCFCVVCKKETRADFWVMKEYGVKESWTKMFTVSFLGDPARIYPLT